MRRFAFTAELERWQARTDSAWFFVFLPEDVSDEIAALPLPPAGWGSVKVRARIGAQTWDTSVFPDAARGAYSLPVKKAVRMREGLEEGVPVAVEVEILG